MEYTPEQQAANRRIWIEALRSGKYGQGTAGLRSLDQYCCLGVACEVSDLGNWENKGDDYDTFRLYDGSLSRQERLNSVELVGEALPPPAVLRWLGLKTDQGQFRLESGVTEMLTSLNDNQGYTFEQIADVIESEPTGLLVQAGNE